MEASSQTSPFKVSSVNVYSSKSHVQHQWKQKGHFSMQHPITPTLGEGPQHGDEFKNRN